MRVDYFHEWVGKLMKTLDFSARTAPSSAFGTFSPAEKRGGEGLSMKGRCKWFRQPVRNAA